MAAKAAEHVNNAFGGQNWREMGRSATTQDWFHILALAPDWLESEMRFTSGLLHGVGLGAGRFSPDEGKNFSQRQVATMAVSMWGIARVLNLLTSGDAHYENPFGLVTKDKDGRDIVFSMRTIPTDILHAASDPMGFLTGRTSPVLRTAREFITGRNEYDQKLTDAQKYVDLQISQFVRLGVFGRWDKPYKTMTRDYEARTLEAFYGFLQKGFVYRGLKPVYWCIHDRTTLAEAEVEYEQHTSPSVYVRYSKINEAGAPHLASEMWGISAANLI